MCRQTADANQLPTGGLDESSRQPLQPHRWRRFALQSQLDAAPHEQRRDSDGCPPGSFCSQILDLDLPCSLLQGGSDDWLAPVTAPVPSVELSDGACPVFWQVDAALEAATSAVQADLGTWLAGGIVPGGWPLSATGSPSADSGAGAVASRIAAGGGSLSKVTVCLDAAGESCEPASSTTLAGRAASAPAPAADAADAAAAGVTSAAASAAFTSTASSPALTAAMAEEQDALASLQAAWPEADLSVWLPPAEPAYVHAPDRGLLHLAPASRDALHLRRLRLQLSSTDPADCLAPHPALRWLLRAVAGYDTAIINGLLVATGGRGFVASLLSQETHALAAAADVERATSGGTQSWLLLRAGTLLSAFFLLFASSALVSFVLAQTQARMLRFTVALQQHVRARLPLARLVASHLLDSLIFVPIGLGTLFFLFEYIGDQLLALLLLTLVIGAEVWAATSLRTIGSLRFFPRLFVTLLTWFNAYYLSFPFGYHYLALATVAAAVASAMFHLWLSYELPALVRGDVSHTRPRHPLVAYLMQAAPPPLPTAPAHRTAAAAAALAAAAAATPMAATTPAAAANGGRFTLPPLNIASAEAVAAALANPSRPRAPSERMSSTGSTGSSASSGTGSAAASRRGSSGTASPVMHSGPAVQRPVNGASTRRGVTAAAETYVRTAAVGADAASAHLHAASAPPVPVASDSSAQQAAAAAASAAFLVDELVSMQALMLPAE